jgi:alpha-tubulin suppressor-like RCC1 family protein
LSSVSAERYRLTGNNDLDFINHLPMLTVQGSPADIPCVVEDLHSLVDKVTRISSGGTLSAALTSGHDIYIWGTGIITGPLNRLWSPTPYPLDLHGQEFLDVAVGNHHVIVLTTEHKIFVIGANGSGQLGVNDRRDHSEWTEITLPLKEQQHVTRVYAGHNNSLLLVEEIKEAGNYTEG